MEGRTLDDLQVGVYGSHDLWLVRGGLCMVGGGGCRVVW